MQDFPKINHTQKYVETPQTALLNHQGRLEFKENVATRLRRRLHLSPLLSVCHGGMKSNLSVRLFDRGRDGATNTRAAERLTVGRVMCALWLHSHKIWRVAKLWACVL